VKQNSKVFLFFCFLPYIPSLSLTVLLCVAPAARFPLREHQAHPSGLLLNSLPSSNTTLGWISPLMQVLSVEPSSSPFKRYFRGLKGDEIG